MRPKIERSGRSLQDLEELIDYLRDRSEEVAARFVVATEGTFGFLAANREVGQLCHFADPRLTGMRVWRVEGFPNHLVYFRPVSDGVEILRVLHGARDVEALFGEDG
jgi:toxin ParE1/3/4